MFEKLFKKYSAFAASFMSIFSFVIGVLDKQSGNPIAYITLGLTALIFVIIVFFAIKEYIRERKANKEIKDKTNSNISIDDLKKNAIVTVLYHHRENNPIGINDLFNEVSKETSLFKNADELENYLKLMISTKKLAGIVDNESMYYVREEYVGLKYFQNKEKKDIIGRTAYQEISKYITANYEENDTKPLNIYIDAGSTTATLVDIITRNIVNSSISVKINLILISTDHINKLVEDFSLEPNINTRLSIYVPSGLIKMRTKAITANEEISSQSLKNIIKEIGKIDMAFMGANKINEEGLYTKKGIEFNYKINTIGLAKNVFFLIDASKANTEIINPGCLYSIKNKKDNVKIISDTLNDNSVIEKLAKKNKDLFLKPLVLK